MNPSIWTHIFDKPDIIGLMWPMVAILAFVIIVIVKLLIRHRERMAMNRTWAPPRLSARRTRRKSKSPLKDIETTHLSEEYHANERYHIPHGRPPRLSIRFAFGPGNHRRGDSYYLCSQVRHRSSRAHEHDQTGNSPRLSPNRL